MRIFENSEVTEAERIVARHFFVIRRKAKEFENACTSSTMESLFGELEGGRLWLHFACKCGRKLEAWETYLTQEQKNMFWIQLLKYENLAKGII